MCETKLWSSEVANLLINIICGFVSENLFILMLQIYINDTKKIVFLEFKDISVPECAI